MCVFLTHSICEWYFNPDISSTLPYFHNCHKNLAVYSLAAASFSSYFVWVLSYFASLDSYSCFIEQNLCPCRSVDKFCCKFCYNIRYSMDYFCIMTNNHIWTWTNSSSLHLNKYYLFYFLAHLFHWKQLINSKWLLSIQLLLLVKEMLHAFKFLKLCQSWK